MSCSQAANDVRMSERRLAHTLWLASEASMSLRDLAALTGALSLSHEKVRQMIHQEAERQGEGINLGWKGREGCRWERL